MKNRALKTTLTRRLNGPLGRLMLIMGARQTGKTTLLRHLCSDYAYISFDDPVVRPQLLKMSATEWLSAYPKVIFDEVQKAPAMFDTVKAMVDMDPDCRIMLSGSSQIMLMERVKESLAGRVSLFEMFPLTIPEMLTQGWGDSVVPSRLCRFLADPKREMNVFAGIPQADAGFVKATAIWKRYLDLGGMPALWKTDFLTNREDCRLWLQNYVKTYLQRDIRDLVMLRELEPFVLAQKAMAAQTAGIINMANLSRDSGISPSTARRFLKYLEISYQIILLQPWFKSRTKRLVKSPKLHMIDPGVLRTISEKTESLSGNEFESIVVIEIIKQLKCHELAVTPYFLRTHDGLEVDLLLEMEDGFIPIEIKQSTHVTQHDARHLFAVESILDKPIMQGFVISNDPVPHVFSDKIRAFPAAWLLG